jgi:hypothetical protein
MPKKIAKPIDGSLHPTKLPQVNKFLQQHGVKNIRLERGKGYFQFWGMPIEKWLNRVVLVDRLDELTLDEWLEKYRQLEEQNQRANPFAQKPKHKKK